MTKIISHFFLILPQCNEIVDVDHLLCEALNIELQCNIFLHFEFEFVFWKNVSNQCFLPIRWPVLVWNAILLNWCKSVWKFGKNPWKFHLNIPIFSSLILVFVENMVSVKPSNYNFNIPSFWTKNILWKVFWLGALGKKLQHQEISLKIC